VDNDDTSSYYKIHHNFFYLGGGVKCDYDGHEKRFYNNVMLGTTAGCWHTCAYKKGFPDYCHDNKLVQAKPRYGSNAWFQQRRGPGFEAAKTKLGLTARCTGSIRP